jgi:hypothetical protein
VQWWLRSAPRLPRMPVSIGLSSHLRRV